MTRTKLNKLVSVFLSVMMTIAFWASVPISNVHAESQADAIVSVALAEEGYTEGANNDNKYGRWYNYNNAPWCAMFISWCANQAGIPENVIKKNASADNMYSSQKTGNFGGTYYPKNSISPQKGDIVYYDWNRNGCSDHVEIVISVNESSKTFTSVGGNTRGDSGGSEGVRRHSNYSFTSSYIVGFERPNYSGSVTPTANDDELGISYPRPQVSSTVWLGKNGITSGDYVKWLQTALNKADNAGLAVDGQFGSGTTTAVKNFQAKHGLTQDGQAGIATINKLIEVIKGQINSPKPPSAPDVSLRIDYDSGYLIFTRSNQENVERYKVEIGIVNGDVIVSNSNAIEDTYKWKFSQSDVSKEYYLKITAVNDSGSSSTTKYFTILPQKPNLEAPNLSVDVSGQEVTFLWNLVDNATGYDLRIYNYDGTSYADYWDFLSNENSLTITMPANTEFSAAVCSKNSNYEECWSYCQPVYFKTGNHEHEYGEWKIEKSATCTSNGYKKRNCLGCEKTEEAIVYATGHDWNGETKEATCSEDGYIYKGCSACGKTEETIISATGHNWSEWKVVREATCTKDGLMTRKCSNCRSEEGVPTYKSHTYQIIIISPTSVEDGYTLHTCSECGDSYKDNFVEKINIKGDINADGKFDIDDIKLLQEWLLAVPDVKLTDWKAADLCEDDRLDVFDLCMMKRLLINN